MIAVITSEFNKEIVNGLLDGCKKSLKGHDIDIIKVPGALEIPQVLNLQTNISKNKSSIYEGYIALGCVIKGETYHFEIVSNETNRGLMNIALKHSFPLGNGVITAYNYDQALKRSLDKGKEAAQACYELIKIKNYNNKVD